MYQSPLPSKLVAVLSACRAVALLADNLEAAPAQVARLQQELDSVNSQIDPVRRSLLSERAAFDAWRRQSADADDFEQTRRELELKDLATQLAERRGELVALQNQIAAEQRKLEEMAKKIRKLERQWANPVAQPIGSG
jgi:predicted  nucleic acid-binding Zn-ribbon protein